MEQDIHKQVDSFFEKYETEKWFKEISEDKLHNILLAFTNYTSLKSLQISSSLLLTLILLLSQIQNEECAFWCFVSVCNKGYWVGLVAGRDGFRRQV